MNHQRHAHKLLQWRGWFKRPPLPPVDVSLPRDEHSSQPAPYVPLSKLRKPRRKKLRYVLILLSLVTILGLFLGSQSNGPVGAQIADLLRTVVGPTRTAQIESWFLGLSDAEQRLQAQISGQHVTAPWTISQAHPVASSAGRVASMPLEPIRPFFPSPLPGEGVWSTDGLPPPTAGLPPLVAKTFLRPDRTRPYGIVTLLQFDMRFLTLHMVAGTTQPGGPRGVPGPGVVAASDLKSNLLVAAFNGGFKYLDGKYGMGVHGTIYGPPQPGAATIAVTNEGQILLGAWGKDPRLTSGNADLAAWRQNGGLLIDHGTVNSLTDDGANWGGSILNRAYTWRSGLGLTASGSLIYAAGNALSALTLGETLKAAGAIMAMQTDIHPSSVRAFVYTRTASGSLHITKLDPGMQGSGMEYLDGTGRDFFYLTRLVPAPAGIHQAAWVPISPGV
ncbi:MAG TPA: hypothetical protein VFB60_25865 [Ktedonobacteraceae bacterium]|nr:hypothetical protein [Ktedonobacteraceae bacterium]